MEEVTTNDVDTSTDTGAPDGVGGMGEGGVDSTVGSDDIGSNPQGAGQDWVGAPDSGYTDEGIEMPEGLELDETVANELAGACQEMGLSQKAFTHIINKMTPVLEQQQASAVESFKQENLKAFVADKELGGARAKETIALANKAYQNLVPEELQEIFNRSGLNTHPAMIKMFHSLAKTMSDDTVVRGGQASGNDLANFFKNSKMN